MNEKSFNRQGKLEDMLVSLENLQEYIQEEETMRDRIKEFLNKHPVSALLEIMSRVMEEKDK